MGVLEFVLNNNEYLQDLITRSTYHSNAIEGKEPREIYETINHKSALELVFKNSQNDNGFNERFIKILNKTINRNIKETEGC